MPKGEDRGFQAFLAVGRGEAPADLLLHNGSVVDVFTGEVRRADIALAGGLVAGVGRYDAARTVVDVKGQYVLPGFIDGHIHIESSLLWLPEFTRLVLQRGTTAVVADPHEIANVLGVKGIRHMLDASAGLPLDVFLMAPSCVPATNMESSGAKLGPAEVRKLLKLERVLGLAEVMNYPGVVFGDRGILAKVTAATRAGQVVDGHAPGVVGHWLQAYAAAGVGSDHECVGRDEAREKLRAGLRLMVREGSAARNMTNLLPLVNDFNLRRCCLVTDDRHPEELLRDGHLDLLLRKAVAQGMHPAAAVQMVTLNPAEYFGLHRRGAVAPGWQADLVVVDSLNSFRVRLVMKNGTPVVRDGELLGKLRMRTTKGITNTVRTGALNIKRLAIRAEGEMCRVIRIVPGQIVTEKRLMRPKISRGYVVADPERDLLKLAVIERHRATGRTGLGLVSGFGLRHGALGTTVAHDSHNMVLVGTNDKDMLKAARELVKMGGGYVAVARGKVGARLRLPIAGLMSDQKAKAVVSDLKRLLAKAQVWGCRLPNPFITLSFLTLPVIPELKLTDQGLVDTGRFRPVSLFAQEKG